METTVDDLLRMIGAQQVQIVLLQQQLAAVQAQVPKLPALEPEPVAANGKTKG